MCELRTIPHVSFKEMIEQWFKVLGKVLEEVCVNF